MKHRFSSLPLKTKIGISFVVLIFISVSLSGLLSYRLVAGKIEEKAFQTSQNTLNKASQMLDEKLKHVTVTVMSLMISESFESIVRSVAEDSRARYFADLTAIQRPFAQMKLTEPLIDSVLITTPVGDFYPLEDRLAADRPAFTDTNWFREIKETRKAMWIGTHEDTFFASRKQVITLILEPLITYYNPAKPVYIIVNIEEESLRELLTGNLQDDGYRIDLVSREGTAVLQSANRLVGSPAFLGRINRSGNGHFNYSMNGDDYLVNHAALTLNDEWIVIGSQSKSDLLHQLEGIKWANVLIIIGCTLAALIFSSTIAGYLLKPMHHLQTVIKRVSQNDLNARFRSEYQDDVSQVGMKFNLMMDEIRELMDKVKEVETEKWKAEMKALQAQIEPHFLYNTLNTIFWRCLANEHDDAKKMVVALAQLFELGLNKGSEVTTVGLELAHVRHYLTLQQQCYSGQFDFEIYVNDDSVLDLPVIKIVLQPLVENSILHGFEHMESGGFIRILAERTGDRLVIAVEDNGIGMDTEAIARELPVAQPAFSGYALRNVYHRLYLYYGGRASMQLRSKPGELTVVKLVIPIESMELHTTGKREDADGGESNQDVHH